MTAMSTPEGKVVVPTHPDRNSFRHRKVRVNEIDLHYLVGGEGEPVVLLHGFPQHSLMWRRVMPALAARHTVVAPDLRGTGGTTITPSGYDKRTMAADVHALVQALGFRRIDVVGYDHGAGVAYQLAARYPELVRRLCAIEYALPGFGYEQEMQPKPDWNAGSAWQLGRERTCIPTPVAHVPNDCRGHVDSLPANEKGRSKL